MAHLRPFLNGTILFSSISPDYEANLKEELFSCFKYIGIPFDVLDKMPIRDRKYYIAKHNGAIEAEKERQEKKEGKVDGLFIDKFTDLTQSNLLNQQKR